MKNVLNFPGRYSAGITYGFQAKGGHLGHDEAQVAQVKSTPVSLSCRCARTALVITSWNFFDQGRARMKGRG